MKEFIKKFDQFGHPVVLNYNQNGDTSRTIIGGFFSILLRIFLIFYMTKQGIVMFKKQDNKYELLEQYTDFEEIGEKSVQEAEILFYVQIRNALRLNFPNTKVPDDFYKYMWPYLITVNSDGTDQPQQFRICTKEDFKGFEQLYETESMGVEGSLICPEDVSKLKFKSNRHEIDIKSSFKYILIGIKECQKEFFECETDIQKLEEFFSRYIFNFKYISNKIDFSKYNERPVKKQSNFLYTMTLDAKKFKMAQVDIRSNKIQTQDSFIQYGQYEDFSFFDMETNQESLSLPKSQGSLPYYILLDINLSGNEIFHSRQIYDFLSLLGDVGATTGVIQLIIQYFMAPIAQHVFTIRAIQLMFSDLNFNWIDSIKIFFNCRSELSKKYEKGQKRIEKEFDILLIINRLLFLIKDQRFQFEKLKIQSDDEKIVKTKKIKRNPKVSKPPEKSKKEPVPRESRNWDKIISYYEQQSPSPDPRNQTRNQTRNQSISSEAWFDINNSEHTHPIIKIKGLNK